MSNYIRWSINDCTNLFHNFILIYILVKALHKRFIVHDLNDFSSILETPQLL